MPVQLLATLVVGLRENSRVKMKINNTKIDTRTRILVSCLDSINLNTWLQTNDARKGINRPKSILSIFEQKVEGIKGFDSVSDFEQAKNEILGKEVV